MEKFDNFDIIVTITGQRNYPNCRRLVEGEEVILIREPENSFDKFAIAVYGENGKIGYIANSSKTVRNGTMPASKVCEFLDSSARAVVIEGTYTDAICRVVDVFDFDKMILKAFDFYNYGEYENALELFLRIGKKYSSVLLLQYTADCLIKMDRCEESFDFLKNALDKEENNKITLMMYATALEKTGKYKEAKQKYLKILDMTENEEVKKALKRCEEKV